MYLQKRTPHNLYGKVLSAKLGEFGTKGGFNMLITSLNGHEALKAIL